jgi:hypothetical protein
LILGGFKKRRRQRNNFGRSWDFAGKSIDDASTSGKHKTTDDD